LLPSMLPKNCTRVGGIASFCTLISTSLLNDDEPIPSSVILSSGEELKNIHHVILATGYHMSYPFLPHLHNDNATPEHANEEILVTTGQITHNLHKDIFYIPDPSLAFIGVPYHVATFSLFEFQAMCVAAIFSGSSSLPGQQEMRKEHVEKIARRGVGRAFHSLKDDEGEIAYVRDMVGIVNQGKKEGEKVEGHSKEWFEAYGRRLVRMKETRGRKVEVEVKEKVAGPAEAVQNEGVK